MKQVGERDLAAWFSKAMRQYDRPLGQGFFGTVTAYTRVTSGSGATTLTTGYLCSIQRNGESAADGNQYAVLGDYVPVVGDLVECWWRDTKTAYVLGSLIPQRSRYVCRVYRSAAYNTTGGTLPITMPFDTVDDDPNSSWDGSPNFQYVCPADGRYVVSASMNAAWAATTRFIATVFRTPLGGAFADVRRGTDDVSGGANRLAGLVPGVRIRCNKGDRLHVGYYAGAVVAVDVGFNLCYAEFAFDRGL